MITMTPEGRRLSLAILAVAALCITHSSAQTQTAITGEIVETYCWAQLRISGPQHAACGLVCVKRGIPVAIVDAQSKQSFVLLPGRDKTAIPPQLIEAMGQRVMIRGEVVKRGNNQFLMVQSWKRAPAQKQ